jgi:hypothetical protein
MKNALAVAFLVTGGCLSIPAVAQQLLPTDVDLRASYCIPVVNEGLRVLQGAQPGETQTDETIRAVTEVQGRADRLTRYLVPRVPYLDATALAAAATQGKRDMQLAEGEIARCMSTCDRSPNAVVCVKVCPADARTKVARCTNLDWLPY